MSTATHRLSGFGDTVGHALGDAWSTGSGLVHDLAGTTAERATEVGHAIGAVAEHAADAAADAMGHRRRRRRPQLSARRVLVIVGIAATAGLLVIAARRSRQPWADEYNRELEPGDPRGDPATNATQARDLATAR